MTGTYVSWSLITTDSASDAGILNINITMDRLLWYTSLYWAQSLAQKMLQFSIFLQAISMNLGLKRIYLYE